LDIHKYTNREGVKNNTNFGQTAGIKEKIDKTCKYEGHLESKERFAIKKYL